MDTIPECKDGHVLIPVEACMIIAEKLRQLECIESTLGAPETQKDETQWLAYCFEQGPRNIK